MDQKSKLRRLLLDNITVFQKCWRWDGAHSETGHPTIIIDHKKYDVRKLVLLAFAGITPTADFHPLSSCGNGCVNPGHLFSWVG